MKVFETIKKYNLLENCSRVAVSVSGGSDSMALLHFFNANKRILDISLVCVNIEHGIRGEDSKNDSKFVEDYCKLNKIEFLGFKADTLALKEKSKYTVEQAARILRYDIYRKILKDKAADCIATAHNSMDRAEGILLNLFRGSGLNGVIMEFKRDNIIRPLMETTKEEILKYLKDNKIEYVTDKTNEDITYSRNFIRHEIMPKIIKKFPDAENALIRFSDNCKPENDYLNRQAEKYVKSGSVLKDNNIEECLLVRAVFLALKNIGVYSDIENVHIEAVKDLFFNLKSGSEINLPNGIICYKDYDRITFLKKIEKQQEPIPFKFGETIICGYSIFISLTKKMNKSKNILYLKNNLPPDTIFRTKQEKDYFKRFGGGTKSLADYFTDVKLERRYRDFIPLIASGSEVIAAIPYNINENYKVENFNEEFIEIKFKKTEDKNVTRYRKSSYFQGTNS